MVDFKVVEIKNPLVIHALCSTWKSAERWIRELAPVYCAKGYFMDKTLTKIVLKFVRAKGIEHHGFSTLKSDKRNPDI